MAGFQYRTPGDNPKRRAARNMGVHSALIPICLPDAWGQPQAPQRPGKACPLAARYNLPTFCVNFRPMADTFVSESVPRCILFSSEYYVAFYHPRANRLMVSVILCGQVAHPLCGSVYGGQRCTLCETSEPCSYLTRYIATELVLWPARRYCTCVIEAFLIRTVPLSSTSFPPADHLLPNSPSSPPSPHATLTAETRTSAAPAGDIECQTPGDNPKRWLPTRCIIRVNGIPMDGLPRQTSGVNPKRWPKLKLHSKERRMSGPRAVFMSDAIPPTDIINTQFTNLVQRLLAFDPSQRILLATLSARRLGTTPSAGLPTRCIIPVFGVLPQSIDGLRCRTPGDNPKRCAAQSRRVHWGLIPTALHCVPPEYHDAFFNLDRVMHSLTFIGNGNGYKVICPVYAWSIPLFCAL
ncbi:hypothetical protein FIBSPDRAFT_901976 [Athelia psychrophila]|uniref:Uncharacterized protein n=1 Tax=Athelia psychrophila TaxID=1759441 RepID=A0A165WBT1_9AGAM|nr:hypothetical protein FIBSPDRAFT_901976 [Fibularhizoctonia sp. CBS 109695]